MEGEEDGEGEDQTAMTVFVIGKRSIENYVSLMKLPPPPLFLVVNRVAPDLVVNRVAPDLVFLELCYTRVMAFWPKTRINNEFRTAYLESLKFRAKVVLGDLVNEACFTSEARDPENPTKHWGVLQSEILRASLDHVEAEGWGVAAVIAGAEAIGVEASVVQLLFPRNDACLIEFCMDTWMQDMLHIISTKDTTSTDPTTLLFLIMKYRLELQACYSKTWLEALDIQAMPLNYPTQCEQRNMLIRAMLRASAREDGIHHVISQIYHTTELYIMQDTSELFQDSWIFLGDQLVSICEPIPESCGGDLDSSSLGEHMLKLCCPAGPGGNCTVYLVGTVHNYKGSMRDVSMVVNRVAPDLLFLELCYTRVSAFWTRINNEFRTAYLESLKFRAKVVLGDLVNERIKDKTRQKMEAGMDAMTESEKNEFYDRRFGLKNLEYQLSRSLDVEYETPASEIEADMEYFFPDVVYCSKIRDRCMMATLLKHVATGKYKTIVAVVGKMHMEGIREIWSSVFH